MTLCHIYSTCLTIVLLLKILQNFSAGRVKWDCEIVHMWNYWLGSSNFKIGSDGIQNLVHYYLTSTLSLDNATQSKPSQQVTMSTQHKLYFTRTFLINLQQYLHTLHFRCKLLMTPTWFQCHIKIRLKIISNLWLKLLKLCQRHALRARQFFTQYKCVGIHIV